MALLFADGFDHYDDAQFLTKWSSFTGSNGGAIGAGRFGNGKAGQTDNNGSCRKTLPATQELIVGMAVSISSMAAKIIFQLLSAGTVHVDVRTTAAGLMTVTRNGTVLATGTTVLSAGVFYYIELRTKIDDSTGTYELRINGITEVSASGVDTRNGASASADTLQLGANGSGWTAITYDDLYVCDTTGGDNDDFLGDVRIQSIFPNGNGNSSAMVGSDGNSTDNYLLVDDTTVPDEDSTYVQGTSVGDKDTYAYGNVTPTAGVVYAVQTIPRARKTDAGARSIATVARVSGTEVDGPNQTLSTSYNYLGDIRPQKPGGGSWSIADVNGAEFGVKVTV